MRYVPTNCLRDGMILARNIYGSDQSLMLSQGQLIKDSYVDKIRRLGYSGVFINDTLSNDIVIESVISDKLKIAAVSAVKDVFINTASESITLNDKAMENTREIVDNLIDELLSNRNLMVNMVDLKFFDDYTFYHSVNVAILSLIVGIAMGYPRSGLYKIGLGALLHDIGKIFIDKEILEKEGPLTPEEFEIVREHPSTGYKYLIKNYDIPTRSYLGALHHHEKYDGTGYPYQLKGDQISDIGRIISVADVYDALTSDRPYRKALLASDAMEYVMGSCGSAFDPKIVHFFIRKVAAFPLGTIVRLSDGSRGIVVLNHSDCCTRPAIRILGDSSVYKVDQIVDLRDDYEANNLTITETLRDT